MQFIFMEGKSMFVQSFEALSQFAETILPGDHSMVREVELAEQQPKVYVERYASRLRRRGMVTPQPGLAFIAFVDGLWERGYLKEISWQEEPQDLVANLQPMIERALPGQFDWSWLNYAVWEDQTTDLLLRSGRVYTSKVTCWSPSIWIRIPTRSSWCQRRNGMPAGAWPCRPG